MPPVPGTPPESAYQSTKLRTPAWTITPTQDRSSALRSRNHGIASSMRAVAAVLSAPVERSSVRAARDRGGSAAGDTPAG
ncbi:unannotated protein [freshwater metagenome]|uniref:Unannotated protein n=1 Tax=freshwater metagenome TaxID=449393 RepID=A0A6J6SEC6_9ZZZZ